MRRRFDTLQHDATRCGVLNTLIDKTRDRCIASFSRHFMTRIELATRSRPPQKLVAAMRDSSDIHQQ
ncbi:hypothetical protein AB870_13920 [Pandoraea faecigallinarum]|uniref:Uncharacterized protein n=1 Tax=Pandoraea faecigallinarum TaxID=656179 RepID=A0A0H3WTL8_9BURK|nr:hypothetical protein AB870_13920 [Pandoraea faecigallinarum]